jgi:anti-anti-sigma regulatory factor
MFRLLNRRKPPLRVPITQPLVAATVLAIERTLAATLRSPRLQIIVDLSQVEECDNAGATLLHAFITLVEDRGGRVEIHAARPAVTAALQQVVTGQPPQTAHLVTRAVG